MKFVQASLFCLLLVLPLAAFTGCGDSVVQKGFKKANRLNIQKIANAYRMFASINGHVGPKDLEELKAFMQNDERVAPRLGLTSGDLEDIDGYFTSGTDGEPFVVLFGQKIRPDFDYSAIVFDKTGVDGMRRIALACSEVIEVTDEKQYERILSGKIKKKDVPAHVFGGGNAGIDEAEESMVGQ